MLAGDFAGFDCKTCNEYLKEYRGCKKKAERPLWEEIPEYGELWRCPLAVIPENIYQVLDLYRNCRRRGEYGMEANGILPNPGGLLDQPAVLIDAFNVLDNVRNDCIVESIEAERKRNGR